MAPQALYWGFQGTLTGNGSLDLHDCTTPLSKTAKVFGTLAPNNGALTIIGKLNLQPSANTVCHVTPQGGMLVGDKVYVQQSDDDGDATLAGRLTVVLSGTFTEGMQPATLVHADGGTIGFFTSYSFISLNPLGCLKPIITYDAHNVILSLVSTCQDDDLDP